MIIAILISPLMWAAFIATTGPLYVLGAILVPLAVYFKAWKTVKSKYYDYYVTVWSWPFMAPFTNWEDGVFSYNYLLKYQAAQKAALYWYFRNPIDGLRWMPIFSCKIDPSKVRYIGSLPKGADPFQYELKENNWFFAFCGLYSNLWVQFYISGVLYRFWIGWKIYPGDIYGVTPYRKNGAGFALQLKAVPLGNNKN
jgi:hypothetical protein